MSGYHSKTFELTLENFTKLSERVIFEDKVTVPKLQFTNKFTNNNNSNINNNKLY